MYWKVMPEGMLTRSMGAPARVEACSGQPPLRGRWFAMNLGEELTRAGTVLVDQDDDRPAVIQVGLRRGEQVFVRRLADQVALF